MRKTLPCPGSWVPIGCFPRKRLVDTYNRYTIVVMDSQYHIVIGISNMDGGRGCASSVPEKTSELYHKTHGSPIRFEFQSKNLGRCYCFRIFITKKKKMWVFISVKIQRKVKLNYFAFSVILVLLFWLFINSDLFNSILRTYKYFSVWFVV